ncbi:pyrimidodiazepine synthase-like isoform X2 [Pollicipes pollicipes]|uniref:pyrimidodiazepine synthase-like isoform X2 n=1 Tax=Pollicipes pollicipes TaxID=41117 RepID=UPI001884D575|nr:pyrimidodiazepine synthase-like isoform X2 [Pollicipes pollicipes]
MGVWNQMRGCRRVLNSSTVMFAGNKGFISIRWSTAGYSMDTAKHLGSGSECPPLKPGTLRVYSMRFCPYAERTRLVLAAKHIPHEVVNLDLKQKPEWYVAKHAVGKVPALELDNHFVPESLVTCDLLEQLYPEPALYPADPWAKARDQFMVEQFNAVSGTMYQMYRASGDAEKIKELSDTFNKKIQPFEEELIRRGTPFYHGDRPGMLDLMIWPWMERFPAARKLGVTTLPEGEVPPPPPSIKNLHEWVMRMTQHPDVKKCLIATEHHMKFIMSSKTGKPDYDMEGV